MKKKRIRKSSSVTPIDSRIVPDIFSFGHVKGVAKIFLTVEIFLSILVVVGTLILCVLKFF